MYSLRFMLGRRRRKLCLYPSLAVWTASCLLFFWARSRTSKTTLSKAPVIEESGRTESPTGNGVDWAYVFYVTNSEYICYAVVNAARLIRQLNLTRRAEVPSDCFWGDKSMFRVGL